MKKKNKKEEKRVNKGYLIATMTLLLILVILVVGVTYQVYLYRTGDDSIINRIIGDDNTNSDNNDNTNNNNNGRRNRGIIDWLFHTNDDIKVDNGTITIVYKEGDNSVNIENAYPTTDEAGKNLSNDNEYMDFTVNVSMSKKNDVDYVVVAEKEDASTIDGKYIKLYLQRSKNNDNYDEEVLEPTLYKDLERYNDKEGYLDKVTTSENVTYYYRLRMWLDESYNISDELETFKLRVNVYGSAK